MDSEQPPQIVIEQPMPCADAQEARVAFERALAPAKAPTGGWSVRVRFERAPGGVRAEGEVADPVGAPAGHREMDGRGCTALAHAMGVWAALVLDAELERSMAGASPAAPAPPPPPPSPSPVLPEEGPLPDLTPRQARGDERQLEVGIAPFALAGTGTGMIGGATLFALSEVASGWFLRPAVGLGHTVTEIVPTDSATATLGDASFDLCDRIAGNYLDRRGIQLDLCAGADVGFIHASGLTGDSRTLPLFAFGPSMGLRGELGSALSALIRVQAEWNALRETLSDPAVTPALLIGRGEVGLSWRFR